MEGLLKKEKHKFGRGEKKLIQIASGCLITAETLQRIARDDNR